MSGPFGEAALSQTKICFEAGILKDFSQPNLIGGFLGGGYRRCNFVAGARMDRDDRWCDICFLGLYICIATT